MSHDVETLLRQALHAEADAAVPWGDPAGTDPWPRVERAHRRTRALRRAGLAGVVVAALAIGGAVTARLDGGPPPPPAGETRDDTWQDLDDGRTRGEPVDDATRAAVATARISTPTPATRATSGSSGTVTSARSGRRWCAPRSPAWTPATGATCWPG